MTEDKVLCVIPESTYYADLSAMRPLHPAWGLWLSDLFGLNVSLFSGFVLMTTRSYRDFKKHGKKSGLMWHEAQHRRQKLMHGYVRFALRYWFSRKWRAEWEQEAYEVSTAWAATHGVDIEGPLWNRWLVKNLSGWRYGWMMNKLDAQRWSWRMVQGVAAASKNGAIEFIDDALRPCCGATSDACYCAEDSDLGGDDAWADP